MNFLSSRIVILLFCLLGFTSSAIPNSYDSIEYNLSLANIKNSVLKVEVTLTGKFKDKLVLDLPFKWAASVYTDQIKNIKLEQNYNMKLVNGNESSQAIITIPDLNNQITLSYEIHQKIGNPSDIHGSIIRDNLVHTTGYGLFALPNDLKENEKIKVNVNWLDIPEKWQTLSSYSAESSTYLNLRSMEILHGFYLAGNIRIYNIGDDANPVMLSLYGKFDMSDRKMLSDISGIIRSQKAFFNDYDFPYYAISLIEGDDPGSMGGTRLINSFTAFIPHKLKKTDYYILFAHENLHNWIGGKINNSNKDEELSYWWTEGFTDYYCRLIALRSKGIDKATFIKETNQILRDYYFSPFNTEPNSKIQKDFWNNYEIQKLPYYSKLS